MRGEAPSYDVFVNGEFVGTKTPSPGDQAWREVQGCLAGKGLDGFDMGVEKRSIKVNAGDPRRAQEIRAALRDFLR